MGLATYDDLKAAVADWLDREDLAGRTGDFITLAEARMNRLMGFSALTVRLEVEAGPGQAELPAPADLREVLSLVRTTDGTAQGYRAEPGRLALPPPPEAATELALTYRARPRLSEAAPVNAVLAEHPDLYLFGALAEAAPFLRDSEMLAVFAARFDAALTEARMREARIAGPSALRLEPAALPAAWRT
ncbi:MAG: hypothetical protein ACK534_05180 [Phenylobacterium sp.]|uniref:phage adaptor protein n=1 Tax=Phenylobacterium sp. TaxID=1871053 RepID=UPI00391F4BE7